MERILKRAGSILGETFSLHDSPGERGRVLAFPLLIFGGLGLDWCFLEHFDIALKITGWGLAAAMVYAIGKFLYIILTEGK